MSRQLSLSIAALLFVVAVTNAVPLYTQAQAVQTPVLVNAEVSDENCKLNSDLDCAGSCASGTKCRLGDGGCQCLAPEPPHPPAPPEDPGCRLHNGVECSGHCRDPDPARQDPGQHCGGDWVKGCMCVPNHVDVFPAATLIKMARHPPALPSVLGTARDQVATTSDIVALATATPDLSTLVAALKAGKLVDTLSGKGPFTVFAPTNEAFAKLPAGTLAHLLDPKNIHELAMLLEYHVVSGAAIFSKDLKTFQTVEALEGDQLTIVKAGRVFVNNATVTEADIAATNGVIHIIDSVLIPPAAPGPDLLQTIYHKPELSTFVIALRDAGRIICLNSESSCEGKAFPLTIFAPSNEAWNIFLGHYPLLLDLSNVELLQKVLDYHFVAGAVLSKDITDNEVISTKEGEDVTAHTQKPFNPYDPHAPVVHILAINNATVTTADLAATNGVVHILDSVLMLPNFPPPGNYTFPYNQ